MTIKCACELRPVDLELDFVFFCALFGCCLVVGCQYQRNRFPGKTRLRSVSSSQRPAGGSIAGFMGL